MNATRGSYLVALLVCLSGCAASKQMFAPTSDYVDYRAFRGAAHPGHRLELAETYLEKHPRGSWIAEVTDEFATSELDYYVHARASREGVREYLAYLPHGPHAREAEGFLASYDGQRREVRDESWLVAARATEAMLADWAEERRAVNEALFAALNIMLSPEMQNATPDSAGALFTRAGGRGRTWGIGHVEHRELRFHVPTGGGYVTRRISFDVEADIQDGRVTGVALRGTNLFLRWAESSKLLALDPSKTEDRLEANLFALETLGAAAEARFPKHGCSREPGVDDVVLVRICHERTFVARAFASGTDEVHVLFKDVTKP